ncbi:MAG: preprotein translocase subunit SecG [Deltaproteobacteria bacterium]|nr:MAG: preprotein translocase subunit SecG [Deltaproteobacteria bacterium]
MTAILIALNVAAGLFLIAVVLLQSGKGADMGAAFGGASSAVFGPSGAGNVLTKITAATAAVFMGTSLALAVISAERPSVMDEFAEPEPPAASIPAAPAEEQAAAEQPAAGGTAAATETDKVADAVKKAAQEAVDRAASEAAGTVDAARAAAAPSAGGAAQAAAESAPAAAQASSAAGKAQAAAEKAGEAAKSASGASATPPAPGGAPVDPVPSQP